MNTFPGPFLPEGEESRCGGGGKATGSFISFRMTLWDVALGGAETGLRPVSTEKCTARVGRLYNTRSRSKVNDVKERE